MKDSGRRPRYGALLALAFLVALPASLTIAGWTSSAESGPESGNRQGNGLSTLSLQTASDVGISSIIPSSEVVHRGDIVTIEVTVQNLGDALEDPLLTLRDRGEDSTLATVQLALDAGQEFTIGLTWDTANAAPQAHILTANIDLEGDRNPDNDSLTLTRPITVIQRDIKFGDDLGLGLPDAFFGANLLLPDIQTIAIPGQQDIRLGDDLGIEVPDAFFSGSLLPPSIDTTATPSIALFVGGADAEYSGTLTPAHIGTQGTPLHGTIKGVVHLEGRENSLGGFLKLGDAVHHMEADGSYTIEAAPGTVKILIEAPGYVSISVPQAKVEAGRTLVVPKLTLRFGDGNGDGVIDILDLSMAADNFGDTIKEVTVP